MGGAPVEYVDSQKREMENMHSYMYRVRGIGWVCKDMNKTKGYIMDFKCVSSTPCGTQHMTIIAE